MQDNNEVLEEKTIACSEKSFTITGLLCFYLGYLGIHRLYTGRIVTGILQIFMPLLICLGIFFFRIPIIFVCALSVWILIDFILILSGKFKDKNGLPVKPINTIQIEEFVSLFFAILSFELSVLGHVTIFLNFEKFFKVLEWVSIIFAIIPFLYGFIGVVIKNQRNAKLFGFISSISMILFSSFSLVCHLN